MTLADYIKFFTTLMVILDPIGVVPIFLGITPHHTDDERRHIARVAAMTVALVLCLCAFVGRPVLTLFGITIASFRVGGGIIFLLMAVAMVQAHPRRAKQTAEEQREAVEKEHVAVVPLAIPLLAGPGAISTMIIYGDRSVGLVQDIGVVGTAVLAATVLWIALRLANPIRRLLGTTGINIVVRVMGLLLAALAVEFIASGLTELLPGLAGTPA